MRTDPLLNIPQQSSGAPDKLRGKLIYRQTEDIMGLATFVLNTSPYFQYNGKLYKRLDLSWRCRFPFLLLLQQL